jgi:hypothetical protein
MISHHDLQQDFRTTQAYDHCLWNSIMMAGVGGYKGGLSNELREDFDCQGFPGLAIQDYVNT